MRKLTNEFYSTYCIESDTQSEVYAELGKFVMDNPNCMVESLTPGFYVEGDEALYTLLVTVAF